MELMERSGFYAELFNSQFALGQKFDAFNSDFSFLIFNNIREKLQRTLF